MHRGVLAAAAVVALWTLPAFAQTTVAQDVFLTTQGDGQYLAKDLLLGAKVHNAEGAIVGDVEDLILNADNQVQGVIMGVGGSVDVLAGHTRRAPRLLQRTGLEWAYRLAQEPRRLFKRYLVTNLRFCVLVGRELAGRSRRSG